MRVALATCRQVADLDADGRAVRAALAAVGLSSEPAVWDDPNVDWSRYDVVLLRSTWDYAERHEAFLAWAERVSAVALLVNPLPVLRWNTDKGYLRDLAAAGVPVVPTAFVRPGESVALPGGEFVVKPAVSAGSRNTARYGDGDGPVARAHAEALLAQGRVVMLQPYLASVDSAGETALVYLDGAYRHALRKEPLLTRGSGLVDGLFAPEAITAAVPTAAERAVGDAAVAAVEATFGRLAYARVDLVAGDDGAPLLLELELTEPSLFLAEAGGSAAPLADGLRALLEGSADALRALLEGSADARGALLEGSADARGATIGVPPARADG